MLIAIGGLWPLIAFAGGLGYSPLLLIAAIVCSPIGGPKIRLRLYMFAILLALEFVAASARWSPRPISLVDFDPKTMSIAVRFEVARVGLAFLWTAVLIEAARTLSPKQARNVVRVATIAILLQLVVVAVLAMFEKKVLDVFLPIEGNEGEGVQNISRNGIIMALAAPFLIVGAGRTLSFSRALFVEIAVFVVVLAVLATRGVNGGIVSTAAGLLSVAIVRLFPVNGFRILGGMIASIIMGTPFVIGYLSRGAEATLATDSNNWRLAIWRKVIEVIDKDPIFGQGLGVLRTMRERIPSGVFKGELYVPNHAHNMVLQLWAETGAIGASLVALAIVLAGFRMPEPRKLGVAGFLAAALAGGFIAIALVSFDLWNDWWWATAGLLSALIVVMMRAEAIDQPSRMLATSPSLGVAPAE